MPEGLATLQNQAVLDSLLRWEERIYLHTDRRTALPGETLFFKGYAMTGPNRYRVSPSGVLKIDLTDAEGTVVTTQYYRLSNGMTEGVLRIPETLDPDTYTLRAYTRWMQNYGRQQFFTRQIRLIEDPVAVTSEPRMTVASAVEFYPEGGKLLAGLNNKLIIRALDSLGSPAELRGVIRSVSGDRIVDVQMYDRGLGMSILRPKAGVDYRLHLANGDTYALPKVQDSGYSLQVNPLDPDRIRITVAAVGKGDRRLRLSGSYGGKTYFEQVLEFEDSDRIHLEVPKAQLPAGPVTFELTTLTGDIVMERPILLEGPEALQIELVPIKQDLRKGGDTQLRLLVRDAEGKPVQAEVSLSVSSEINAELPGIAGHVQMNPGTGNPGRYRKALFLDDLYILGLDPRTQRKTYPDEIVYPIQEDLELIGYAYDLNNELLRNTTIQVMSSMDENLFIAEVTTDPSGILEVSGIDFDGEVPLIFRTEGEDTPSSLVRFEPLHDEIYKKEAAGEVQRPELQKRGRERELVETTPWAEIDTTGLIALAEATVTAKKQEVKQTPSVYGIEPRRVIRQDPKKPANSIGELLQRMPGVFISGNIFDAPSIRVPSAPPGPTRWVVDGLLLVANQNPFDLVPIIDVERIELLSAADASIYGSRGTGAIFAIYTRNGADSSYVRRKDAMVTFKGFEPGLSFDSYMEERQKNRKLRNKIPGTLYWNPSVQTDEKGEAIIEFRSPADYNRIRIQAETLTQDGRPGAASLTLSASETP